MPRALLHFIVQLNFSTLHISSAVQQDLLQQYSVQIYIWHYWYLLIGQLRIIDLAEPENTVLNEKSEPYSCPYDDQQICVSDYEHKPVQDFVHSFLFLVSRTPRLHSLRVLIHLWIACVCTRPWKPLFVSTHLISIQFLLIDGTATASTASLKTSKTSKHVAGKKNDPIS